MHELMERTAREEAEWRTARLHEAAHHNWLGPDECPACHAGERMASSHYVRLTPMARDRIGYEDFLSIEARCAALNAQVGAIFSSRHGWITTAETPERRIGLRGKGPLATVLAGLLDDLEQSE